MKTLLVLRCHWDRTLAAVLVLAGIIAIVAAGIRARDSVLAFEQLTFLISGGIAGLALVAVGLATWLSADLRDEWRQMRSLEDTIRETFAVTGLEAGFSAANGAPVLRESRQPVDISPRS